jgi:hypothetical protein
MNANTITLNLQKGISKREKSISSVHRQLLKCEILSRREKESIKSSRRTLFPIFQNDLKSKRI